MNFICVSNMSSPTSTYRKHKYRIFSMISLYVVWFEPKLFHSYTFRGYTFCKYKRVTSFCSLLLYFRKIYLPKKSYHQWTYTQSFVLARARGFFSRSDTVAPNNEIYFIVFVVYNLLYRKYFAVILAIKQLVNDVFEALTIESITFWKCSI